MRPGRRRLLLAGAAGLPGALLHAPAHAREGGPAGDPADLPPLRPDALAFPRDFGAHPQTRIEWWYLTGVLESATASAGSAPSASASLGVQLTFFRIRTGVPEGNPSRFSARQLVLAHAAIADPSRGALLHEERIARTGFGVAQAAVSDTGVAVDRWRLERNGSSGSYMGHAPGVGFTLDLTAQPTQPLLLQGELGYSRKGSDAAGHAAASFYYSEPQLALQVRIVIDGRTVLRRGRGWLDHEWSNTLLPPTAAGWDWGGFNLDDGTSLTVFRVRGSEPGSGGAPLHAYAALRSPGAATRTFLPGQVTFEPLQVWVSPRTRVRYPVAQRITVGDRVFETQPLMADQEYVSAGAGAGSGPLGGPVYWEGASTLREQGRPVGVGYLELTGYAGPALGAGAG